MKTFRLREVFTPGGLPSVTYVARQHLRMEKDLRAAIERGHAVITVTGPTKSGKTVLCRTVLHDEEPLWLEGGRIGTAEEFWEQLIGGAETPFDPSVSVAKGRGQETIGEIEGSASILVAKTKAKATHKRNAAKTTTRAYTKKTDPRASALKLLREANRPLIIDDFHFVDRDTQRVIINSLKAEVFNGLIVVLIAVPHRAFDPISVQQEMQGRFIHIETKPWTPEELRKIPDQGFPALNVVVPSSIVDRVTKETFLSPLLVQDICSRICIDSDVSKTCDKKKALSNIDIEQVFVDVAANSGFPTFDRLKRGPQSRKQRTLRPLREGGQVDIYQAILMAVALAGPKAQTTYDEIRDNLRELLADGALPQKHEVTAACGHMSKIARNELANAESIEWHDNRLIISDPFLLFFMKWREEEIFKELLADS